MCKIGRSLFGVRLIFYNAGRAPYDVVGWPVGHRPMLSYTYTGRRQYICDHAIRNTLNELIRLHRPVGDSRGFKRQKLCVYEAFLQLQRFSNICIVCVKQHKVA